MSELSAAGYSEHNDSPNDALTEHLKAVDDVRARVTETLHNADALEEGEGLAYYNLGSHLEGVLEVGNIDFCIIQARMDDCLLPGVHIIYNETTGPGANGNLGVLTKEFQLSPIPGLTADALVHTSFMSLDPDRGYAALALMENTGRTRYAANCGPTFIQANTQAGKVEVITSTGLLMERDRIIDAENPDTVIYFSPPDDLEEQADALVFAQELLDIAQQRPPTLVERG